MGDLCSKPWSPLSRCLKQHQTTQWVDDCNGCNGLCYQLLRQIFRIFRIQLGTPNKQRCLIFDTAQFYSSHQGIKMIWSPEAWGEQKPSFGDTRRIFSVDADSPEPSVNPTCGNPWSLSCLAHRSSQNLSRCSTRSYQCVVINIQEFGKVSPSEVTSASNKVYQNPAL